MAEILEMLNDGRWHLISDVEAKMNLNASQSKEIIKFLKTYEFVSVDQKNRVKLKEAVREFLSQGVTS